MTAGRRGARSLAVLMVGLALSGVFLFLALRDIDWPSLGSALLGVRPAALVFCMSMIASGILLRSWRWRLVTQAEHESFIAFARSANLGALSNQLLPGRLGEVVRVFTLVRLTSLGLAKGLSGAVIDRALDVAALLIIAWLVSLSVVTVVVPGRWVAMLGAMLLLVALGVFIVRTQTFRTVLAAWSERWIQRWALRAENFLTQFYALGRELMRVHTVSRLFPLAGLIILADYLAVAAAVWAAGVEVPIQAPIILWVLLAIGSTLPSAPAYLGIYQLAAVWGLAPYGVPAHQAVAVAFILQAATLFVSFVGAFRDVARVTTRH